MSPHSSSHTHFNFRPQVGSLPPCYRGGTERLCTFPGSHSRRQKGHCDGASVASRARKRDMSVSVAMWAAAMAGADLLRERPRLHHGGEEEARKRWPRRPGDSGPACLPSGLRITLSKGKRPRPAGPQPRRDVGVPLLRLGSDLGGRRGCVPWVTPKHKPKLRCDPRDGGPGDAGPGGHAARGQ